MSYIYENMPAEMMTLAGFFETQREPIPFDQIENLTVGEYEIGVDTQILFYPGAFGVFHAGHVSAIQSAIDHYTKLGRKVLAVISPCNAEYSIKKYGAWSPFSSNKLRFDSIKESMPDGCVIDTNCMLNYAEDQNFTDMILHFVERHNFTMDGLTYKPVIISGKDRQDWNLLEQHCDSISVFYVPDTTGESTSALKNYYPDIEQKTCILRCHNVEEYKLFSEYFGDQYYDIIPRIIEQERVDVIYAHREAISMGAKPITICKDYVDLMPYYRLSREWINPFEQGGFTGDAVSALKQLPPTVVFDSDVFTGSTEEFVKECGHEFVSMLRVDPSVHEIIDIDDLRKHDFCYPYVDISYRCSMRAFDIEMHDKFFEFKNKLKEIK